MKQSRDIAIKCPSCHRWSSWPGKVFDKTVIADIATWDKFQAELPRGAYSRDWTHILVRTCQFSDQLCPSPFSAIFFRSRELAHWVASEIAQFSFSTPRAARLYTKPKQEASRHANRFAVLFFVRPAKNISFTLPDLLPAELISHTLAGMATRLQGPLTLYVRRPHRDSPVPENRWYPVEATSHLPTPVPPNFNPFCSDVRELVYSQSQLQPARESDHPGDRVHQYRKHACPCFSSDLLLLDSLEKSWVAGTLRSGLAEHRCWAGLNEIAAPIVVNGILVAAVMTGQQATRAGGLHSDAELFATFPFLQSNKILVDKARRGLEAVSGLDTNNAYGKFVASRTLVRATKELLTTFALQFQEVAEIAYERSRTTLEHAFRAELTHITGSPASSTMAKLLRGLNRMMSFWSFSKAAVINYWRYDKTLNVRGVVDSRGHLSSVLHPTRLIRAAAPELSTEAYIYRNHDAGHVHPHPWMREVAAEIREVMGKSDAGPPSSADRTLSLEALYFVSFPDRIVILAFSQRPKEYFQFPAPKSRISSSIGVHLATQTISDFIRGLDLRHPRGEEAFSGLAHGLKHSTDSFLKDLQQLCEDPLDGDFSNRHSSDILGKLYLTALNITGPHDSLRYAWESEYGTSTHRWPANVLFSCHAVARFDFYKSCASLVGKDLTWSKAFDCDTAFEDVTVAVNKSVVLGVLDILYSNAIEHGGDEIRISLKRCSGDVMNGFQLSVSDNGRRGMQAKGIKQLTSDSLASRRSRFGLNAARRALQQTACNLILASQQNPTRFTIWCPVAPKKPYEKTNSSN